MKLAIYGAGGLGREVLELAMQINKLQSRWSSLCFIDDINANRQLKSHDVLSLALISPQEYEVVVAVGEPSLRKYLAEKAKDAGFNLATLIHPDAYISSDTTIGMGSVICYGAFISCDTVIGDNVHLQPNASLGHDCCIGNHCVISSYANLAGHCIVGDLTFIGMNAVVRETSTIGAETIISMGSAVFNDIASGVIAMGNPARAIRKNDEKKVFR
ncbi:acetyltransferase [Phytobacter diazotrophicus]|jgi:sugar O-acyltransferase (sialic acid O-acetyltransferase NeuD family)|uniref:acetyltransferase n=1 Tax=Phytobacter diazotrophicus TaxID=395631 RepID=UPI0010511109|nr:acetyltransferase [Phytobacter diazotrophicus]MDU7199167.1 acetyltransferase [Enterobacteriaceae bacterium]MDV2875426.1 acetyltransferase [Phytobacter diazotrophicus]MDV2900560.1 acetyltransferase [Phytobacter diazotrophicus]TCW48943.1 sugar O-acyltransferase (sialic acid O-acetyltransferase NeuD family) [Phytobacter diazotrophicus]